MENVVSKSLGASPSMTSSNKNVAQFLDSASQELTKLMQDNELLGMFFKDQIKQLHGYRGLFLAYWQQVDNISK